MIETPAGGRAALREVLIGLACLIIIMIGLRLMRALLLPIMMAMLATILLLPIYIRLLAMPLTLFTVQLPGAFNETRWLAAVMTRAGATRRKLSDRLAV
jgi:ABC-type bacteriocin/lantibiotic exporter with double-glycine peptidase domain